MKLSNYPWITPASEIILFTDTKTVLVNGELFPLGTDKTLGIPEMIRTTLHGKAVVMIPVITENLVLTTEEEHLEKQAEASGDLSKSQEQELADLIRQQVERRRAKGEKKP